MNRTSKLALWVLLPISVAGCSFGSNDSGSAREVSSHHIVVTDIELENVDNGQPVLVGGEAIFGSVQIDD